MGWGDGAGPSFVDKVKEDAVVQAPEEVPVLSNDGSLVRVVVLDSNAIFKGYGHPSPVYGPAGGARRQHASIRHARWHASCSCLARHISNERRNMPGREIGGGAVRAADQLHPPYGTLGGDATRCRVQSIRVRMCTDGLGCL